MMPQNDADSVAAFVADRQQLLADLGHDLDDKEATHAPDSLYDQARLLLRHEIGELLLRAGQHKPPINPYKLASFCGVRRITRQKMNDDGRIVRTSAGYDIELDADAGRRRQRFSLAHELAHTFFLEYVPVLTESRTRTHRPHSAGYSTRRNWRNEEALANFGAAELLLPAARFLGEALELGPSLMAARHLADRWDVSLECCCRRLIELRAWPVIFVWLARDGERWTPTNAIGLSPGACIAARSFSAMSPASRVLSQPGNWSGRLSLSLDGTGASYYCDVQSTRDGSRAILLAADGRDAEAVTGLSRLRVWAKKAQPRK